MSWFVLACLLFGPYHDLSPAFSSREQIMSPRECPRLSPQGRLRSVAVFVLCNCLQLGGVPHGANGSEVMGPISAEIICHFALHPHAKA